MFVAYFEKAFATYVWIMIHAWKKWCTKSLTDSTAELATHIHDAQKARMNGSNCDYNTMLHIDVKHVTESISIRWLQPAKHNPCIIQMYHYDYFLYIF